MFMAERALNAPVCLHGRDGFRTREECYAKLLVETVHGRKRYRFVCPQHLEDNDCFYEGKISRSRVQQRTLTLRSFS